MIKAFLSYAREDFEKAKRLFDFLNSQPTVDVWMDKVSLIAGVDWKEEILTKIRESDYVIILLSTNSTGKRGFFQKEMSFALETAREVPAGQIYLIPARLNECEVKNYHIQSKHHVDLFPDWNEGVTRIIDAMETHIRKPQPGQSGEMRFTSHQARFSESPQHLFYFLNINNGNSTPVEITHIYYQDAKNHIRVNPSSRPLPKRLQINETWSSWIAVENLPESFRSTAFGRFQLRLSDGSIHKSIKEDTIAPHGSVPGGAYSIEDTRPK